MKDDIGRYQIKKIMQMPVHFLQESGKGFFVKKEGCALMIREELEIVIRDPAFVRHVQDWCVGRGCWNR